ncbi:Zn-dependent hydrolase, partial [Fangia hongkongensis]|nr:Zn-dependent hydrolase [Fangia hongkongensis]
MLEYKISDIRDYFDKAAKFSSSDRGVTRLFCSEEHKALLPVLRNWMEGAGLQVRLDALGNLRGFKKSKNKEAKTLIIGSHQDSVIEGG